MNDLSKLSIGQLISLSVKIDWEMFKRTWWITVLLIVVYIVFLVISDRR